MAYENVYADLWYYSYPQIKNVSLCRCDVNGDAYDNGAYLKISATRSYSKGFQYGRVDTEMHENRCEIGFSYKQLPSGSYSAWATILSKDNLTTDTVTTVVPCNLDGNESYEVIVGVKDTAGSEIYTSIILSAGAFMHKDGAKNSIAIGEKVTEENTVSIAEKLTAVVKGLLKTYGNIYFYDKNGTRGAYANYRVICVPSSSGNVDATMGVGYVDVGNGIRAFASMRYDPENNRGYVFINDAPENPTDATNKAYVDAKINALRKELGLEEE